MRAKQKEYRAIELTDEMLKKIKSICQERYSSLIYNEYFANINTVEDLCALHETTPEEEMIILGEDWFISYVIRPIQIDILEWVAIDNVENKMTQIREMLTTLKYLLFLSKKTCLSAFLRHDTSYKFYKLGVKKGLIKPAIDEAMIDYYHPEEMDKIIFELQSKYQSLENFFSSPEANSLPEYEQYILHKVAFTPTKKFIKEYKKSEKKKAQSKK